MWWKKSFLLSTNFLLLQSSDGTSKPELLETRHETAVDILQPEEDLNIMTASRVSLVYTDTTWVNRTSES